MDTLTVLALVAVAVVIGGAGYLVMRPEKK